MMRLTKKMYAVIGWYAVGNMVCLLYSTAIWKILSEAAVCEFSVLSPVKCYGFRIALMQFHESE